MIISATARLTRKQRACADCYGEIPAGATYVRLFGSAHPGERPYVVNVCPWCPSPGTLLKLSEADRALVLACRDGERPTARTARRTAP